MKLYKITLGILTSSMLLLAANTTTVKEESLGLRKASVYNEDKIAGDKTQYGSDAPGTSKKINRAYENAPPMIPHDVEGFLPITKDNNQCITCHEPAVAESMGATPVPKTHFTSFRPETKMTEDGTLLQEGKHVDNIGDIKSVAKPLETLSNARFNCSACHVPQSTATEAPKNTFKPEFRSKDANSKSNLINNINDGVK